MHADALPITGPCPIDLDAIGFDRTAKVAHCSHCVKSVTILSNMTRGEAREFLSAHKGETLCVSYARDEAGRIRFAPEPEPVIVPISRLRPRPSRAAGLVAAFGVTAALAACAPHGEPPRETSKVTHVDGGITVPKVEPPQTPPEPIVEPEPDRVPVAGVARIPPEIMVDGEMAVPDPATLDEPCDTSKAKRTVEPKPPSTMMRGEVALPR